MMSFKEDMQQFNQELEFARERVQEYLEKMNKATSEEMKEHYASVARDWNLEVNKWANFIADIEEKYGQSEKSIGRPSLGLTKKVSVTMPEEYWVLIEEMKKDTGMSVSSIFASAVQLYVNQFESN